ncbi:MULTISPECIES: flagellar filament capping protein FliD [unclassified Pseudomonas]|uniref:flagellar filament capping protein FliD n=1 Tax=unclassified Pseudomonas TaxID=196821 RepID=UPI0004E6B985|nr:MULTISPECIES: flagellar filament capping protein FliD [unclassified Pseudomonas]KFF46573.1 flagellar cap protein FliD [Pseudomonas sp. BRG-100]MBY8971097.1 flagellar filament capping protein FliD [Pseudomonas sp. P867]MCK3850762.1 flagellar cap protein FliD [Pseudomonas sp. W2Jun17]MCK3862145.1 flagellar cap protein FliD [Pseudomonas sp. B329]QOY70086.1 flagellar filament capping protein FliD [Pseudomonas sp. OST1909]
MASSTISGPGSGYDTQAIVKALVGAEQAPKQQQITNEQKTATVQLSAVGSIKTALEAYQAAITKLNNPSAFNGLAASSSEEKNAKVTLGDGASSGKYVLQVDNLATASKVTTAVNAEGASGKANTTDEDQTLTINQSGKSFDVVIPGGATLQQVRESINTQLSSQGISANVLSDSNGARLVLTSTNMGEGTDITLSGDSQLASGYDKGTPPTNAKYSIDGIAMSSSSNKITSAISGVTLELLDTIDVKKPTTITVASNTDTLKTSVQSFVSAYNTLMTAINTQTKVTATGDASTTTAGALTGDASMRQLVNSLRSELVNGSGAGTMTSLAQMGITTDQKTGLLSLDDKTWDKAVVKGAGDIAKLFTGDTGLITRMNKATKSYVGTTGTLATRATDLNNKLTDLTKETADLTRRMDALQKSLTAKYTAMDTMIAQINASSSSILTTLNSLNNPKSN